MQDGQNTVTKLYIFNPQNDLALATGGINYVAPPFAMHMAHDLAVLPAFIAEPGSMLITDSDLDAQWLEHLNSTFGLDVHAVKRSMLRHLTNYQVMPWGWCLDMRRRLIKWGASSDSVPSKDTIYHLRGLSHRRVSILIHKRLHELLGHQLCPTPVELATPDEVMQFVKHYRNCYIKTPWSSSGRGIYHTIDGATPELEQWCFGALKRQGSVMCEVALDKVIDFAVEFHCCDGKAIVRGFSIFSTDSHSQYTHGYVAPCNVLKSRITALYPDFDEVVEALTQVVDELVAPHYTGWMGIDMLLFNKPQAPSSHSTLTSSPSPLPSLLSPLPSHPSPLPSSLQLNPCVELNLRPTMGAITSMLGDNIIAQDATASFSIEQRSSSQSPWPEHDAPVIEDHRLRTGTLCLTPASPDALYRAILTIQTS